MDSGSHGALGKKILHQTGKDLKKVSSAASLLDSVQLTVTAMAADVDIASHAKMLGVPFQEEKLFGEDLIPSL